MIKSKDSIADRGLEIDLTGPDGNAFYLLGTAMSLARQFDIDGESIVNEMISADYEHLLGVFEDNFAEFVTLYRQTMKEVYIDMDSHFRIYKHKDGSPLILEKTILNQINDERRST